MTLTVEEYDLLVKNKDFATLRLSNLDETGQPMEDGAVLYCKSEALHRFFKKQSQGKMWENCPKWGIALFPNTTPLDFGEVTLDAPGGPLLLEGYVANLTFLRAVDLDKGVKIRFDGVFKTPELSNFFTVLKRGIQEVYLNYMHPFDVAATFSTKEYILQ